MPLTTVESCKPRTAAEVQHLLESVYQAQIEAFNVPDTDRQIRYYEVPAEHCYIPPGRTDNFTVVTVQLFSGRTVDAKRTLYRTIVTRFAQIGIPASDVFIGLVESPRENWSMSNGVAACDL